MSSGTQVQREDGGVRVASHRQRLVVIAGASVGVTHEVRAPRLVVGSGEGVDVRLDDALISRRHFAIEAREGRYFLSDLESTNGTFVEGVRIERAELSPRARIRVGDTELSFEPKVRFERVDDVPEALPSLRGRAPAMREVRALLAKIAPTDLSIVLTGETGTGKDVAARAIHAASARAEGPFVVIDCAAMSPTLVEAELFGHERGAFTGADRARPGAFVSAAGGTVFLDEIGELPIELQPRLLRALERREVKRLGGTSYVDIDVRIVAATHRDLSALVKDGTFRADLWHRLAEVVVDLPPLRARGDDVAMLAQALLDEERARTGKGPSAFTSEASARIASHAWPGNVRELRNLVRRLAATTTDASVSEREVTAALGGAVSIATTSSTPDAWRGPLDETLDAARARWSEPLEKAWLEDLLARTGSVAEAARIADVHPKSLERLLRQHGLRSRKAAQ